MIRCCKIAALTIAMSLAAVAAPVLAQSRGPVTLTGVFDPDLPDITPRGEGELTDALNNAPTATQPQTDAQATAPPGYYPPPRRAEMVVVTGSPMDPAYAEPLGEARVEEVEKKLGDSVHVRSELDPKGADGTVRVIYGPVGHDTDPPVLKVDSDPTKGTVVYPGQTITVTIKASERYQDGHQSWPSGVREIQLLDDAGVVKSWDYGMRPPPCAVPTETWPYTVPANPPAVVHLKVETQSASDLGYSATKTTDFPTGNLWKGSMRSVTNFTSTWQNLTTNVTGETWQHELELVVAGDGTVSGKATSKLVALPKISYNFGPPNDLHPIKAKNMRWKIKSRRTHQQFELNFQPTFSDGWSDGVIEYTLNYNAGKSGGGGAAPLIVAPLTSATTAAGDTTVKLIPATAPAYHMVHSATHDIQLQCVTCSPASGSQ
jgi:hypothetical protein